MNYIVYDMEFMVTRTRQDLAEILEIGAVKLTEAGEAGEAVEMVDIFQAYVLPTGRLTPDTTSFTGIGEEELAGAPSFPQVIDDFRRWLGDEDTYYLCSWGPDDLALLLRHCERYRESAAWIRNHNDLQRLYAKLIPEKEGKQLALRKALRANDIPFFGKPHRALDDAFNTAKLFRRLFPQLALERNRPSDERGWSTKVVYTTAEADDADPAETNPFGKLAALLDKAM